MSELKFRSGGKSYNIPLLQLRYAQGAGKKSLLVPFKGKPFYYPYPLNQFYSKVKLFGFVLAQKSYVVNHKAVMKTGYGHHHFAELDNGEEIYITKEAFEQLNVLLTLLRRSISPAPDKNSPWVSPN